VEDRRSAQVLWQAADVAVEHAFKFSWSDKLTGPDAKKCSRNGGWQKRAASLIHTERGAARGEFACKCRARNPALPAVANNLVLVEIDLDVPDDVYPPLDDVERRVAMLMLRLELSFPTTLSARSRRGVHFYQRPPRGQPPAKVQIAEKGGVVTWSTDGYVIAVPALHEFYETLGVVYEYVRADAGIAELELETYELLRELSGDSRGEARRAYESGEAILEGSRRETVFGVALRRFHDGYSREHVLAELLGNAAQFNGLTRRQIEEQIDGAAKRARKTCGPQKEARQRARRVLNGDEQPTPTRPRHGRLDQKGPKARALFLPFEQVRLSGPIRWVWRGKIPESAVTLLAGRPKQGKSLLSVWLASQLSRGLLEGAHFGEPARTLLIPAEDPIDPIVKGRLIAAAADELFVGTLAVQGRQDRQLLSQEELGGLGGLDGAGTLARRIVIPDEYDLLEQLVVENEIALVALDPINSFLAQNIDAHRDVEIRRVLDPLAALCARRHFAALAVVHLNRRTDSDVLNRITGSGGYGGSARSILTFGRHPENDLQRVVASEGNWQKEAYSELFELREVVVFPDAALDEQTQPALVHVGTTDLDSSDLIEQLDDDRSALDQAKEFLFGELVLGPVSVTDLKRGAEANGISWRTVERAKKLLAVEARRVSSSSSPRGAGRWEWFLEISRDKEAGEA
jgi:putative DNA primase/helicase